MGDVISLEEYLAEKGEVTRKTIEGVLTEKDGELVIDWKKFHLLYVAAKDIDPGDIEAVFGDVGRGYTDITAALMQFGILHFHPVKDEQFPDVINYEIVAGYDNTNMNPRLLAISTHPILYFTREEDAKAYKEVLFGERLPLIVQVRRVEVVEFEV